MDISIYPDDFRAWLFSHYSERLASETRPEAKAFLRATLHNLQKRNDG